MGEMGIEELTSWSSSDVLARVQAVLPSLPPSQQRVARSTLDDPQRTAASTISELATRCDTSETTVLRFCRTVGFAGYPEFRIAVAAAVGEESASGRAYISGEILAGDSAETVIQKISTANALALLDTSQHISTAVLEQVSAAVLAADRIECFGMGASSLVAADLNQKLARIGLRSSSWVDAHGAMMNASQLTASSVAIAFSHGGETVLTSRFLEVAGSAGAKRVAITNVPGSTIATQADLVLTTSVRETAQRSAAMASRIAQLGVVDILFSLIARADPSRTQGFVDTTQNAVKGL